MHSPSLVIVWWTPPSCVITLRVLRASRRRSGYEGMTRIETCFALRETVTVSNRWTLDKKRLNYLRSTSNGEQKKKGEFQLDDALLRSLLVWHNFFVGDSNRNCLQKSRTLLLIYLDVRRQLTSVWLKGKRGDHLGGGQLRRRSSAKNKCPIVP